MDYSGEELLSTSFKTTKPDKENGLNAPYRFPKYIDGKLPELKLYSCNVIEFISEYNFNKSPTRTPSVNTSPIGRSAIDILYTNASPENISPITKPPVNASFTSISPIYIPPVTTISANTPEIDPLPNTMNDFKINLENVIKDGRTTCMIKNIPNKFTVEMLIDFVNQSHFGKYNFLYLRMDFKNKCNVGYAFINFIDTLSIESFYYRISGKRWKNFSSYKIAELTYASIQGLDNLIRKFKKSSVMQENESFRPKVFYTKGCLKGFIKPTFEP